MITPNLDHLAATGLTFAKAYCQQAVCGPSRASFMTGRRPDHTMVFGNSASFRKTGVDATGAAGKDWVTMPEYVLCVLCVCCMWVEVAIYPILSWLSQSTHELTSLLSLSLSLSLSLQVLQAERVHDAGARQDVSSQPPQELGRTPELVADRGTRLLPLLLLHQQQPVVRGPAVPRTRPPESGFSGGCGQCLVFCGRHRPV